MEHQFRRLANGVFTRMLFVTSDRSGWGIEVRDVVLAPKAAWRGATFPGATLFELLGGDGSVREHARDVLSSRTLAGAVSAQTPVDVVNAGDQPFIMRIFVAQARVR
ncbi:MAG: hypothetical protein WBP75_14895 [Candidatus Cybelea sp.]